MTKPRRADLAIWFFAFGYFACYIPYSALTKAISGGWLERTTGGFPGVQLLPWSTLASLVGMLVFLTLMGWWKYAGRKQLFGRSVPSPNRWTFASGLCTAAVIATTTLAYTFDGVSIVFMMLLMRGGVLILAPIVDALSRRHVRWFSWMGLVFSLLALVAGNLRDVAVELTIIAIIDVALYLASYFVRLRFMSRLAKSDDRNATIRYFVEEQMVATPAVALILGLLALVGAGGFMQDIRAGYTSVIDQGILPEVLLVGLFSQGTGIFGGLILLSKQENSYCVPVNRSSSILAGVLASYSLTWFVGKPAPPWQDLVGAALIICAILFLTLPALFKTREAAPVPRQDSLTRRGRRLLFGAAVGAGLGVVALVLAVSRPSLTERAELWAYDLRARLAADAAAPSTDIVIVDIGESDIASVEENFGVSWPWKRELYAHLLSYISEAGARVVVFDWVFQDRGFSVNDAEVFADAMRESGKVVFGIPVSGTPVPQAERPGGMAAVLGTFESRDDALRAALRLLGWHVRVFVADGTVLYGGRTDAGKVLEDWARLSAQEELADLFAGESEEELPPEPEVRALTAAERAAEITAHGLVTERYGLDLEVPPGIELRERDLGPPFVVLASAAARLGNVSQRNEIDGIFRRHLLLARHQGRLYPSLPLAAYLVAHPGVTPRFEGMTLALGERRVPVDEQGRVVIRYRPTDDRGFVYAHVDAYEVLRSVQLVVEGEAPSVPPETFKDKYVFVSATATALRDLRPTPVASPRTGHQLGAEINANVLDNLLRGDALERASPWTDGVLAFGLTFLVALLVAGAWTVVRSSTLSLVGTLLIVGVLVLSYAGLSQVLLEARGLWFALAVPAAGAGAAALGAILVAQVLERGDRRFVQEALGRYTSGALVKELIAHPERLALGGERREMSVYFSDIANFTSFSERLEPERLVLLLNDYLTQLTDIVLAHGGVVDKYIGDAIMAFWGAPLPDEEHARKAVRAALAMRRKVEEQAPLWKQEFDVDIVARAGVSSGPCVVGNMGSQHKFNYTVMGDMVNLASRLEGANKPYGTTLMISETTEALVRDVVETRELDLLAVKGKEEPVKVYEVLEEKGRVPDVVARAVVLFHEGLALYRAQKFADALEAFEQAVAVRPDDGPSRTYIGRCRHFLAEPPGKDWDGVWRMKEK